MEKLDYIDYIAECIMSDFMDDIPSLFKNVDYEDEYVDLEDFPGFYDIEAVYPNKAKGAYCVLWADGEKTVVHCNPADTWDEEKALALCFMKKTFRNTGYFNEILKKWVNYDDGKEDGND